METRPAQGLHLTLQPRLEALISSLYPSHPLTTPAQGDALFSQSIHLLTLLNNPLNIELLTRHILQSPAIWASTLHPVQRYARIVAGFHSGVGWKLADLNEGKAGLCIDEWILATGRGATGSTLPWRHLLLFSGLRSALKEEVQVSKKTKRALEDAYVRALAETLDTVTKDISEAILYTLALMEHTNPLIIDKILSFRNLNALLLFLIASMFSPSNGFFRDLPIALSALGNPNDTLPFVQEFHTHILQPYIPRIAGYISRVIIPVRDPLALLQATETINALSSEVHHAFSSLSEDVATKFTTAGASFDVKGDETSMLWESLKRLLFATVMSLQGLITNIMHSSRTRTDAATLATLNLEILGNLAFVSARFGYSAFDEWNFVYLASIDFLSPVPQQANSFIEKRIPNPDIRHPAAKAAALYFLDTLEHFIPILPAPNIHALLPVIIRYLNPLTTPQKHLESAHSVFLAILARGDILHDQILPYLDHVYSAFPQALSPRQVRLAFSTVVKLSPEHQTTQILDNLLRHVQAARTDPLPLSMGTEKSPMDEQLTYLLAFVDCLPWVLIDAMEFWLEQFVVAARSVQGSRRDILIRTLWDCLSGEMGGEAGFKAVEWWVNGGKTRILTPKL